MSNLNLEMYKKALHITKIIKDKGGNIKEALSLIKNNPKLLELPLSDIDNHLYLIINAHVIYAALYVANNNYWWSNLKDEEFLAFVNTDFNADYIIDMVMASIDKYLAHTTEKPQSLEEKIKLYNLIKKNEEGYHLK